MHEGARQRASNLMYVMMSASLRPDGQIKTPATRKAKENFTLFRDSPKGGSPEL